MSTTAEESHTSQDTLPDTAATTMPTVGAELSSDLTPQMDIDKAETGVMGPSPGSGGTAVSNGKSGMCGVCNENPGKYKCPRCRLPYCSVACNKTHKENHAPDPEPPKQQPAPHTATLPLNPKPDPTSPFSALESSDKLQMLFKKYPHLPDQLLEIHAATQPPPTTDTAFPAGLGAKPSDSRRLDKEIWNTAVGVKRGKEALQRARAAGGVQGEAVREYQELVLYLLSEQSQREGAVRGKLANREDELLRDFVASETRRSRD